MKIMGYRLEHKYEGSRIVETKKFLTVIECCGLEIMEYDGDEHDRLRSENNYRVYLRCAHPSENYFIIGNQKLENGFYKWLTKAEAEDIVERAFKSDVVDLREFGDYHFCYEGKIQTVAIMNEYDEFDDDPVPIVVKLPD